MFPDTGEKDGHFRPPHQSPDDHHHQTTTPRVLTLLSNVLERLVNRNDQLVHGGELSPDQPMTNGLSWGGSASIGRSLKAFDGVRPPSISIPNYLERMYKYTNCSPSCFVVGFIYIDRLLHKYPGSLVVSLNVHRLLVTSVMVASKMLDDVHYNNAVYARVGGVSNTELNRLEIELLFKLDFGVVVSSQVFESYCQHLEKEMLRNGGESETKHISRFITPPFANSCVHDAANANANAIAEEEHTITKDIQCNSLPHEEHDKVN